MQIFTSKQKQDIIDLLEKEQLRKGITSDENLFNMEGSPNKSETP